MNLRLRVFLIIRMKTQLSSTETMKSCILLKTYRKVPKSHGDNLYITLMCVYRPIECFDDLCLIYFDIFFVNLPNFVPLNSVGYKNTIF